MTTIHRTVLIIFHLIILHTIINEQNVLDCPERIDLSTVENIQACMCWSIIDIDVYYLCLMNGGDLCLPAVTLTACETLLSIGF